MKIYNQELFEGLQPEPGVQIPVLFYRDYHKECSAQRPVLRSPYLSVIYPSIPRRPNSGADAHGCANGDHLQEAETVNRLCAFFSLKGSTSAVRYGVAQEQIGRRSTCQK